MDLMLAKTVINYQKELFSKGMYLPKSTMIALANAGSKPSTMMIKLKNASVTVMTMLSPWRLHIREIITISKVDRDLSNEHQKCQLVCNKLHIYFSNYMQ